MNAKKIVEHVIVHLIAAYGGTSGFSTADVARACAHQIDMGDERIRVLDVTAAFMGWTKSNGDTGRDFAAIEDYFIETLYDKLQQFGIGFNG